MNNNEQMEYIWHNISTNLPRRTMRALVKGRTVVWFVLLSLIGFCIWQGVKWWRLNTDIKNATLSIRSTIDHQLKSLREDINLKTHRLAFLEEQAFSFLDKDLISWVTTQVEPRQNRDKLRDIPRIGAKAAKTQIIGVEHLKEHQVELYVYAPVKFTLRGDYHSFGRLINQLERSQYPLKIDYLSVANQRRAFEELVMDIVLCQVSTTEEPTKVEQEEQSLTVFAPHKSSEKRFKPIGADFVYPSSDRMRDIFQRHHPEVTPQENSAPPPPLSLILTGVIYNEHNPVAILMDRQNKSYLARVNDTILDYTVLKIEPRSVILNRGDTQIEDRFCCIRFLKYQQTPC